MCDKLNLFNDLIETVYFKKEKIVSRLFKITSCCLLITDPLACFFKFAQSSNFSVNHLVLSFFSDCKSFFKVEKNWDTGEEVSKCYRKHDTKTKKQVKDHLKSGYKPIYEKIVSHEKSYITPNLKFYEAIEFLDLNSASNKQSSIFHPKKLKESLHFMESVEDNEINLYINMRKDVKVEKNKLFINKWTNIKPTSAIDKCNEIANILPNMREISMNYLLCPGGSASVERSFSCSNTIVTDRRTRLTFERAMMLTYIKFNHKPLTKLYQVGKIQL